MDELEQQLAKEGDTGLPDWMEMALIPLPPPDLTEETLGLPEGAAARLPRPVSVKKVKRRIVVRTTPSPAPPPHPPLPPYPEGASSPLPFDPVLPEPPMDLAAQAAPSSTDPSSCNDNEQSQLVQADQVGQA